MNLSRSRIYSMAEPFRLTAASCASGVGSLMNWMTEPLCLTAASCASGVGSLMNWMTEPFRLTAASCASGVGALMNRRARPSCSTAARASFSSVMALYWYMGLSLGEVGFEVKGGGDFDESLAVEDIFDGGTILLDGSQLRLR